MKKNLLLLFFMIFCQTSFSHANQCGRFFGVKPQSILITSGGTKEFLDDVRFMANVSKGSLGLALAKAALAQGYEVTLLAPKELLSPEGVERIAFVSTYDLQEKIQGLAQRQKWDVVLHAAAVADYTPLKYVEGKISSDQDTLQVTFVKLPKLIKDFRALFGRAFISGFKLETDFEKLKTGARKQIKNCRTNLCIANLLQDVSSGFHKLYFMTPEGGMREAQGTKASIATQILEFVAKRKEVHWFETQQTPFVASTDRTVAQPLLDLVQESRLLKDENGNLSIRYSADLSSASSATVSSLTPAFLVSPRGVDKSLMTVADFSLSRVNLETRTVISEGALKSSIDSGVAGVLYQKIPQLQAMIHSHSKWFLKGMRTTFPYPCGVKEEAQEILQTLADNQYNGKSPFLIELIDHGFLLGLTSELSVEKLKTQWAEVLKDLDQHWQDVGADRAELAKASVLPIVSMHGFVGGVLISADGSVSPRLHPNFQGQGYGKELIAKMIENQWTVKTIAECEVEKFYLKMGYTRSHIEGRYIYLKPPGKFSLAKNLSN